MSKSLRAVLISLVTVCICLALIIGGTYALFSDNVEVNSHLAAGSLKVKLDRVSYRECVLTEDGVLAESQPDNKRIDLTNTTTDDIKLFDVENSVPGCWYEVTLELANGGNVAFDYGMKMLWNGAEASEGEKALAEQIQITVTEGDKTLAEFMLGDCATAGDGNGNIALGAMLAEDAAKKIVIRATFINDDENNTVQENSIAFDLQVYATQKTTNG